MAKVFLCHSSQDKDFIRKLAADLNKLGLRYWFDEKEILVGDQIRAKIEEGLKESDYLAIVLSPASVRSQWVSRELDAKLLEEIQSRKVAVLPILYQPCEIPLLLVGKHYADFTKDYDAGLQDLVSRFKKSDREEELKIQLLSRLTKADAKKLDPHLLMQIALGCDEADLAGELAEAHEATHPGCGIVTAIRAASAMVGFHKERTAQNLVKAMRINYVFCVRNPNPSNFQTLAQVAKVVVKDPSVLVTVFELLTDLEPKIGTNRNFVQLGTALLDIANKCSLSNDDALKLLNTCSSYIDTGTIEALRPCIGRLIHIATHRSNEMPTQGTVQEMLDRIYTISVTKVEGSLEYSDAFLHLAWLAAKRHKSREAKEWLSKFSLTVPKDKYEQALKNHSPLDVL